MVKLVVAVLEVVVHSIPLMAEAVVVVELDY
jgi:hypothetical protein